MFARLSVAHALNRVLATSVTNGHLKNHWHVTVQVGRGA
jgi:hypothetical protein